MTITEITNLQAPELDVFARLSETELKRIYEPRPGLFIAEGANVVHRALDGGCEAVSLLVERLPSAEEGRYRHAFDDRMETRVEGVFAGGFLFHPTMVQVLSHLKEAGFSAVPVFTATQEVLEKITGFHLTGGVLCAMKRPEMQAPEALCAGAKRVAVLDGVTNPTNVGAIFRSAAALYADAVLLTNSCSDPLYRRAIRTGMGTMFQIPWAYLQRETDAADFLRGAGFVSVAMALSPGALSPDDIAREKHERLAILMGSEGYGLSDPLIRKCDRVCRIPMAHGVDSLNVAAASAVAFWSLFRS